MAVIGGLVWLLMVFYGCWWFISVVGGIVWL